MRYTVRTSFIDVVGYIWMPNRICSMRYTLSAYDLTNIREIGNGRLTRDAIEDWLTMHSGDFQRLLGFYANIEDGKKTREFPWPNEEVEMQYLDTMVEEA